VDDFLFNVFWAAAGIVMTGLIVVPFVAVASYLAGNWPEKKK